MASQGPVDLLRPCLEALAAEGAGAALLLVVSAADRQSLERAALEVLSDATVVFEPRPGASHARNRALAECAGDEVIAYLDDDSVVQPGWWNALAAAWGEAEADVAAIGGPIDVRLEGDRPPWLADELLAVFAQLDYGPDPVDIDPHVRGLAGPNMSFRCGPLRRVGGFDPALGPTAGRPGFGEEDATERALVRAGHRIRYDPRPRVWHVVDPVSVTRANVLHRRLRYGRTLRGRRPAAVAARRAIATGGGAALAALRGDERLAMMRAFRAAENAGALIRARRARA